MAKEKTIELKWKLVLSDEYDTLTDYTQEYIILTIADNISHYGQLSGTFVLGKERENVVSELQVCKY